MNFITLFTPHREADPAPKPHQFDPGVDLATAQASTDPVFLTYLTRCPNQDIAAAAAANPATPPDTLRHTVLHGAPAARHAALTNPSMALAVLNETAAQFLSTAERYHANDVTLDGDLVAVLATCASHPGLHPDLMVRLALLDASRSNNEITAGLILEALGKNPSLPTVPYVYAVMRWDTIR